MTEASSYFQSFMTHHSIPIYYVCYHRSVLILSQWTDLVAADQRYVGQSYMAGVCHILGLHSSCVCVHGMTSGPTIPELYNCLFSYISMGLYFGCRHVGVTLLLLAPLNCHIMCQRYLQFQYIT